jgi:hypothetical protein
MGCHRFHKNPYIANNKPYCSKNSNSPSFVAKILTLAALGANGYLLKHQRLSEER